MKYLIRVVVALFLITSSSQLAKAQGASVYFGLGTAVDSSSGQPIDTFGNGTVYNTPKMGGLFENSAETSCSGRIWEWDLKRASGARAIMRASTIGRCFTISMRFISRFLRGWWCPNFKPGLGGANIRFYENQSYCDSFGGCTNQNYYVESSNHFQLHFSGGLRLYVKGGLFVRPQVDVHWVNNFFQFGSNWVPEYSAAIGYTFGRSR